MRKITEIREFNVYKFEELSQAAKEKVRDWYIEGQEPEIFTESCMMRLSELFPNSDLKVQYSLNYCQGDGLNIYGTIRHDELLEKIAENFTEKEMKYLQWVVKEFGYECKMEENNHYCYCICSRNDFTEDLAYDMENNWIRGIRYDVLEKFNKLAGQYLDNLCKEFEENGYDWFYEISDEDLQEHCEANDYEFLEDGKFYVA